MRLSVQRNLCQLMRREVLRMDWGSIAFVVACLERIRVVLMEAEGAV